MMWVTTRYFEWYNESLQGITSDTLRYYEVLQGTANFTMSHYQVLREILSTASGTTCHYDVYGITSDLLEESNGSNYTN